jgi:mRNA-degrading endonuclease toxin of MazEF toxin-antitoxin module
MHRGEIWTITPLDHPKARLRQKIGRVASDQMSCIERELRRMMSL